MCVSLYVCVCADAHVHVCIYVVNKKFMRSLKPTSLLIGLHNLFLKIAIEIGLKILPQKSTKKL